MKITKISCSFRPIPQRDSVRGRYTNYLTKKQIAQQNMFEAAILEQCSYLFVGGVFVFYELIFRVPKGTPTKKKALMLSGDIMRDITPDRVNCEDFLDNRLKNTIIEDDAKIIFGGSIKRWGLKDETVIYIAKAENTYSAIDFCKLVMDMVL